MKPQRPDPTRKADDSIGIGMRRREGDRYRRDYHDWFEKEGRAIQQRTAKDPINDKVKPSESFIWNKLQNANRPNRKKDANGNLYEWDFGGEGRHSPQIEKYDKFGKHKGAFDPLTGERIEGPKAGRGIDTSDAGTTDQKYS